MVKTKTQSRPLSVFQVLFKANLIFKDFSRQSCIFNTFQACANPVNQIFLEHGQYLTHLMQQKRLLPLGGLISSYLSLLPVVFTGLSNVG